MTISPFARMFLLGTLEQALPFIPYLEVMIASPEHQAKVECLVRYQFREYFLRKEIDPFEWKMTGEYSPRTLRIYLGKACTEENIFAILSHELIHHLITYLIGSMASFGIDRLLAMDRIDEKEWDLFIIDEYSVL